MNYEKEKQIFAKAVEQDMDRLYLLVYDILKNPQDAEDALANAILKAWETRGNMKHPDRIRGYLARTALNEAKTMFNKRKKMIPMEEIPENIDMFATDNTGVWESVDRLKTREKEVVRLYYYYGYSVSEVADMLQIAQGTVKSRLSTARKHLRKEWEDEKR